MRVEVSSSVLCRELLVMEPKETVVGGGSVNGRVSKCVRVCSFTSYNLLFLFFNVRICTSVKRTDEREAARSTFFSHARSSRVHEILDVPRRFMRQRGPFMASAGQAAH